MKLIDPHEHMVNLALTACAVRGTPYESNVRAALYECRRRLSTDGTEPQTTPDVTRRMRAWIRQVAVRVAKDRRREEHRRGTTWTGKPIELAICPNCGPCPCGATLVVLAHSGPHQERCSRCRE